MGAAQLPRAYFNGFTYWNPSTMNNNDCQPTYDPASATLNWTWLERQGLQDPDQFDAYVIQPSVVPLANAAPMGVDAGAPPAEWNFYGDNGCGFVQDDEPVLEWPAKFSKPPAALTITGYTDAAGQLVQSGDPWIGEAIRVNAGADSARLVDVDPICPWSSQIFADTVMLGATPGEAELAGGTAGRAHSRWVFFARNLNLHNDVIIAGIASSMWQLGLPTDQLSFADRATGPLASQLRESLAQPGVQGLMVRFVTYHTIYFQGSAFTVRGAPDWKAITGLYHDYAAKLAAFERGERSEAPPRPVNRAYSNTVGFIAPWTTADMRTMAVGRTLHSSAQVQPINTSLAATALGPAALEYAVDPTDPALVGRVSIDLGTTIPELGSCLTKVNFGPLTLALVAEGDEDAAAHPLATIDYAGGYDAAAYGATAGVVDIPASAFTAPLTVAALGQQRLIVTVPDPNALQPQVALREDENTAETDDRAVYLNQPGASWSPSQGTLAVQVRHRGGKPPAGTRLRIAQYSPNPVGFNEVAWELVSTAAESQAQAPFIQLVADEPVIDGAYTTVAVPDVDDGLPYATVTVAVSALRPGPPVVEFTVLAPGAPDAPPPSDIKFPDLIQQHFANVRVLPFHNEMAISFENWLRTGPSVDLVTQRVFDAVFRTFFMMYPAMRFLRDPLQFQAWRGQICAVTDPAGFETASYMPVTRSLSAGQRRMLELWNTYVDGKLPTPSVGARYGRRG
jgi:hypothetical protein